VTPPPPLPSTPSHTSLNTIIHGHTILDVRAASDTKPQRVIVLDEERHDSTTPGKVVVQQHIYKIDFQSGQGTIKLRKKEVKA
jgi:hypothetical protein